MTFNFDLQPDVVHKYRYERSFPRIKTFLLTQEPDHWIVLATLIASLAVAWIHLHHSSIWYDEAITLLTTSGHAKLDWALGLAQFKPSANFAKILSELYQQDVHPPLYFWTLAIWRVVFGESLEVARALSTLFTLCTLIVLYRVAASFQMRWPSAPVVIYAVSAVGFRYAYNARPYAMASFLIVLTLFLARKKSRWTGVCAAACIATHYFAALCVVPILLVESVKQWQANRRWVALTAISFGLGSAPLIPLLRVHIVARPHQYPTFSAFPLEVWALLKGSIESIMPSTWLPHWGFALSVGACFILLGCWWARKRQEMLLPLVTLGFLLGFLILAIATNKSIAKMPTDYYLGLVAPFLAMLMGFGVASSPRGSPILALVLLSGAFTSVSMTKTIDYRVMVQQIRSECPDCPILVGVGYAGAIPACVLYEANGANVFLLEPNDSIDAALQRIGDAPNFFLIPANEPATSHIEYELIHKLPASLKNGYFEIEVSNEERESMNGLFLTSPKTPHATRGHQPPLKAKVFNSTRTTANTL